MTKKKKTDVNAPKVSTQNYYDLKKDAVERLVNADKKTYPKTKVDPGKEYRSGALSKIPAWVKALFIKFWFNGAVCFFIFWGLGLYITDILDMIVVIGIVHGVITDILVNNAFRFFETYTGENSKWMMFPQKKYWTFIANIIYSSIVLYIVVWLYNVINEIANMARGTQGEIVLGVEPILFGIFFLIIDLCFIGMKRLIIKIIADAKQKNGMK
ncbi:MAG: hypothetical protein IJ282_02100 [Lachnospiraceae bacterium]|nr:hypothetical protein [Lachnospiraceae bacterium]